MPECTHYINGKWMKGKGDPFVSINPATDGIIWEGAQAQQQDIDRAVQAARNAFSHWSGISQEKRKAYLVDFSKLLSNQREKFAKLISQEMGKPYWESLTEVGAMSNKIDISIRAYQERCPSTERKFGDATRFTRFRAHGVIAVFGPYNLPGHLPNGHIVPALLAGNTVVFKPSELTPAVGARLAGLWEAAGLPKGVFNLLQGGRETGRILSKHPGLDGLYFTGSFKTGQAIHRAFAGRPDKILALEMGGNNPLIVHEVKDKDAAAYVTINSAFITSGQRCVCARRLIIPQGQQGDKFVERLIDVTRRIKTGYAADEDEPFMGPLINKKAGLRILKVQENLQSIGGRNLVKCEILRKNKALLSPGIIDVSRIKRRADEEIFGPLLSIIRVKDFGAALHEANQTAFGLSAGLLSDNLILYQQFFKHVRAGIINWNRQITGASSEAPFGGIGRSGNHRPSAFFAADYCSYPVASIEDSRLKLPAELVPGLNL